MISTRLRARGAHGVALAALALAFAACDRPARTVERPYPIPVDVYADTGRSMPLRVAPAPAPAVPARAAVWLARVSPARSPAPEPPVPEAAPETLGAAMPPPPGLTVDEDLKPPLPRARTALSVPRGARGFVELDVRVDEQGLVSDALWAGGSEDPALVEAATRCALEMRFYPALRSGQPVAVWCRQRFDFGVADAR